MSDGIVGQRLIVKRAAVVNFDVYGEAKVFRTQRSTVGELLREKKIEVMPEDRLDVPAEAAVLNGMSIHLARTGKQTLTVDEPVPYEQIVINDVNMDVGTSRIEIPGVDGVKSVTYELNMINGREASRTKIQEIITTPASKERVVKGIKINGPAGNVAAEKQSVMAAVGIAASDFGYVDYIISHESGWCATKWQGQIGYCPATYQEKFAGAETAAGLGFGLCQSTPAIKMSSAGADWRTSAITQMKWCDGYARSRYGSWANAYSAWLRQRWW